MADGGDDDRAHHLQQAVAALTETEWARLRRRARRCARWAAARIGSLEPEDLLHAALDATLAGERTWDPAKRSLFQHLRNSIGSIAGNAARHLSAGPVEAPSEDEP